MPLRVATGVTKEMNLLRTTFELLIGFVRLDPSKATMIHNVEPVQNNHC